jgi:hypothetical protein
VQDAIPLDLNASQPGRDIATKPKPLSSCLLSIPAIVMKLPPPRMAAAATGDYDLIAFVFAVDFLTQPQVAVIKPPLAYLPFSALVIAGFLLRLAAFAAQTRAEPISAVKLPNVSQPD